MAKTKGVAAAKKRAAAKTRKHRQRAGQSTNQKNDERQKNAARIQRQRVAQSTKQKNDARQKRTQRRNRTSVPNEPKARGQMIWQTVDDTHACTVRRGGERNKRVRTRR